MPILLEITFCLKQPSSVHTSYPWRSESMTNFPFFYVASQHIILTPLYTCHCSISLSLFTKVNKLGFFLASQASDPKSQIMKIHESTRFSISFRPALNVTKIVFISEFEHEIFGLEVYIIVRISIRYALSLIWSIWLYFKVLLRYISVTCFLQIFNFV